MKMKCIRNSILSFALLSTLLPLNAIHAAKSETPQIDAGRDFSIALAADGTVWTWGSNSNGQLGDGTTTSKLDPSQVANLSGIADVSAGEYHTLALKEDGTVLSWGSNSHGQLGDGTPLDRTSPVKVKNLDHVIAVEAGGNHSMAIKDNGTLWAWGNNDYYQLGDGTAANRALPVQVKGITNVKSVALGLNNTLLLKNDGTVWSIGYNDGGQIGNGTFYSAKQFVQVKGLTNVVDIAIGGSHALAVKKDGTVWAWGRNVDGQVGDSTAESRNQPTLVEGITNAVAVGAAKDASYAIGADGTLWSWGSNYLGTLGLGTDKIYQQYSPMIAGDLTDAVAIDAGLLHAVVLKKDGTVWGMGKNADGQLGNGGGKESLQPIPVNELVIGKGQGQTTPATPTTPTTPSTPTIPTTPTTPTTPTNPANSLVITGTVAKVLVSKATPYSNVTVMNVFNPDFVSQIYSNFGSKVANERGEVVFTELPAGKYYVIESMNGKITRESAIVEVTNEKTANLIDEARLYFSSAVLSNQPQSNQVNVTINFSSIQNAKLKEVAFKAGDKSELVNMKGADTDVYYHTINHEFKHIKKTVTIVATDEKGNKHTAIKQADTNLIDDKSVVSTRNGSHLIIKGQILPRFKKDEFNFYVLQGGALYEVDPGFKSSSEVDFEFAISTGYSASEIQLIAVLDKGYFEVINPIP